MNSNEQPQNEHEPLEEIAVLRVENEILRDNNAKLVAENKRLEELATKDALTGIYNRRGLDDVVRKMYSNRPENKENKDAARRKVNTVLVLDIDNFKVVNDLYGHAAGDQILRDAVAHLSSQIRSQDVFARTGGEEFVIVFKNADPQSIIDKFHGGSREKAEIKFETEINGEKTNITFSGGVAEFKEGDDLEKAIDEADKTLYKAKEGGRDRIEKAA